MKRFIRIISKWLFTILIILVASLFVFYLMAPIYTFSEAAPFKGDRLYNPYQEMDSTSWKKYNFQVQSKAWLGITDGRKNTNERIDSVYKLLSFDHVATSDYQKINYYGKDKDAFIPTYEHGYNIFKTHQVCINADQVLWTDLFLFQTLSMKQWIIDQLKVHSELVALAHPSLRNGYLIDDMKYLTHYDLMEVLNHMRLSLEHWDMALSSGQMVWILANDDSHDVLNTNEVARRFTLINSPSLAKEDIVRALKTGNAYGVDFHWVPDEPMMDLVERIKYLPVLTAVEIQNDSLIISASQPVREFRFIGQEGMLLSTAKGGKTGHYKLQGTEPYVRTEVVFNDGTTFYLNPVIRYTGDYPASVKSAQIDGPATRNLRIIYFLFLLTLAYLYARRKQKKRSESHAK